MRQEQFETLYAPRWRAFEEWLRQQALSRRERAACASPFASSEAPRRYREVCRLLALARSRDYGATLVERLHALATSGHDVIYGAPSGFLARMREYLTGGFAREVRALKGFVLASLLLMMVPFAATGLATRADPEFAYMVMKPETVWKFEEMYGPQAQRLGRKREADTDAAMFGFYIYNNISVAFRCYAGGVLGGLGSMSALVYNGVFMGAVEGRVLAKGYGENFYSFVAGHSAFELFAIVLSGACGLRLGWALLVPGRERRGRALVRAARESAGVIAGAAVMLLIAAGIEAFWSPLRLAPPLKYSVGGVMGLIVASYFLLAGRARADR
jgi:uncharacterized membrane protein SpoIIM required for sporulation